MSSILNTQRKILNESELKDFWQELLPALGDRCILLLNGEVGTGKTTSTRLIADILGMRDVQSPSFAIHLSYVNSAGKSMEHLDLYRLKDEDDLESSGFWDLFYADQGLIIIEWAQRLNSDYLPLQWQRVEVKIEKNQIEGQRIISTRTL